MFHIYINNTEVALGSKLPDKITNFEVVKLPILSMPLRADQIRPVKQWLNSIMNKLDTEWVIYNSCFIKTEDLVKFTDI